MFLTEDEARKQICPFIRFVVNEGGVIQDREPAIYVHQDCKASDCKMAWRWERANFGDGTRRGYCGIAGYPELDR